MIRITISVAAFEAIAATLPLGRRHRSQRMAGRRGCAGVPSAALTGEKVK
jgi:hypothetical protein